MMPAASKLVAILSESLYSKDVGANTKEQLTSNNHRVQTRLASYGGRKLDNYVRNNN